VTRKPNLDGDHGAKARMAAAEARRMRADARAATLAPIIAELRAAGVTSLYGIAMALNARGVPQRPGKGSGDRRRCAGSWRGSDRVLSGGPSMALI